MKIEKLPSGSYRIRKMYKGKIYTVITEYKPSQKDAIQLMAAELDKIQGKFEKMTFGAAAEEYIASKRNVLSPTTIRSYGTITKMLSTEFSSMNINDITVRDVQIEINRLTKGRSPKTIRNYHGFISSVLGVFCPHLKLNTTLPQKIKNKPYIPTDDDIKKILEYAKDSEYEIAIILACYGMRRSEICALTLDDINGDVITINKALVMDENKQWVIKTTKTTASTREIIVPMKIADQIRKKGYVYKRSPNSITEYLEKAEADLGIPHFSLHKLRHYFASKLSAMNVPEADIIKFGGWETDYVMKGVYRHAMEDRQQKAQRDAANKLGNALFSP